MARSTSDGILAGLKNKLTGKKDPDTDEINAILARPNIAKIRKWNSSFPAPLNQMIQNQTFKVVRDYVKNKNKKK